MIIPQKKLERKLLKSGYQHIIAVDEVGMVALAGPVVVCAFKFNKKIFQKNHKNLRGLRDSKLLSAKQREKFAASLMNLPGLNFQISLCYPKTIDRLNIYQASRLAMRRAVNKLATRDKRQGTRKTIINRLAGSSCNLQDDPASIVLIDGPRKIDGINLEQISVIKGDRKVFAIACASIIAKVTRDQMMVKYAKRFPNYGFEKHKGYGTKLHIAQLTSLGLSLIHRKSFAPVSKVL